MMWTLKDVERVGTGYLCSDEEKKLWLDLANGILANCYAAGIGEVCTVIAAETANDIFCSAVALREAVLKQPRWVSHLTRRLMALKPSRRYMIILTTGERRALDPKWKWSVTELGKVEHS